MNNIWDFQLFETDTFHSISLGERLLPQKLDEHACDGSNEKKNNTFVIAYSFGAIVDKF